MHTFIQGLNLRNSTTPQVIARIWHNSRPRKVGTFIWITLNQGLPVGTWLQHMGIPPHCKICDCNEEESPQHCLLECPRALEAWEAYKRIWKEWEAPEELDITWPFVLLGEGSSESGHSHLDHSQPGSPGWNVAPAHGNPPALQNL